MCNPINCCRLFWDDESGLSAVEYVVAGALVIAILVIGFKGFGITASGKLSTLNTAVSP